MRKVILNLSLLFPLATPCLATTMDLSGCPTDGTANCTNNGMTIDLIGFSSWNSNTPFGMSLGEAYLVTAIDVTTNTFVVGGADFFLADGGDFTVESFRFQHGHGVDSLGNGPFTSYWEGFLDGVSIVGQTVNATTRDGPSFIDVFLSSFAGKIIDTLKVRMGQSLPYGDDMGIGGLDFSVASVTAVPLPAALPMMVSIFSVIGGVAWLRGRKRPPSATA